MVIIFLLLMTTIIFVPRLKLQKTSTLSNKLLAETTFVVLAQVRPSLLSLCEPWLWFCTQTFHSFLLTKLSSVTKPLRSGFGVRSLVNDRKHYEKTNVHISGILPWIMWHITIPNWFKWTFFFFLEEPNRISVCRTTKRGHGGATWRRHWSHYGQFWSWHPRGPWQMRVESKAGEDSSSPSLASYWHHSITRSLEDGFLRPDIIWFIRSSLSTANPSETSGVERSERMFIAGEN